ncbi:FAD-dependent monooxygenase [Alteromonas sp. D210916BOD_24]|uniref:FAD-dependent monooxygenase n=1 Tax=Alteromonas sp. D210916BOD_24 TaxID=3157618 RepID=UPI00399CDCC8
MYDFCINGGGMVGAALALGLAQQHYNVAVIEPTLPAAFNSNDGPDLRVSAISEASVTLLKALGAWQYIEAMRVKPYTGLSVWEDEKHRTDFTADSINVPQLGYFVENRLLQLGCHQALAQFSNVTVYAGVKVKHIGLNGAASHNTRSQVKGDTGTNTSASTSASPQGNTSGLQAIQDDGISLTLDSGEVLHGRWLVGADGANSQVRKAAGIGSTGWQYAQQAMGITVKMEKPVDAVTWQQFTPTGPKAFLPMYHNYASLIWYDSVDALQRLKSLNHAQLTQEILRAFPRELVANDNHFTIVDKAVFPLTRSHANNYVKGRCVLIGDAAHTINPLAGQGVNLGYKDVEAFLSVTRAKPHVDTQGFANSLHTHFEVPRRRDNAIMMTAMDAFYTLFSNDVAPISWFRNQLLSVAQRVVPAKKEVLKYAIGLR